MLRAEQISGLCPFAFVSFLIIWSKLFQFSLIFILTRRATFFPVLLFKLYMLGWLLGAIYSVPPIRTKQNPILAGLTIATVRGFLLNFGVYYAVKDAIGAPFSWSPKVSFIARFMTAFATVIAVTKDLPDVEGDKVRYFYNFYFEKITI